MLLSGPPLLRRPCSALRRQRSRCRSVALASSESASDPQRWTPLNKPVVRLSQAISYGEFLSDVRSLAVKEVVLAQEGTDRALVVYRDGRVRYCQFPVDDGRIADVMATYGVVASLAPPEPAPPDTPRMRQFRDAALYWIPAALVFIVYAVVQHGARTKGDWEDRVKLRQLAESERKQAKLRAEEEAAEDAAAASGEGAAGACAAPSRRVSLTSSSQAQAAER
jgi:hypothetical protein